MSNIVSHLSRREQGGNGEIYLAPRHISRFFPHRMEQPDAGSVESVKENMEERAERLALYIIENRTTVRAAAQKFGISKSTVHMVIY